MRLDIRKATVAETLIDLGARMGVSMGGVEACKGKATPLSGLFTLREALDRVIRDRGCAYAFVDSRTIRFTAARPAAPERAVIAVRAPSTDEPIAPWRR